jgi:hypothetical protein
MNLANLLSNAWRITCLPAARRFERALANPGEVQRVQLMELIRRNRNTAFGRKHGFNGMLNAEEFRANVPLGCWEELKPWIGRIRNGEDRVLTADRVTRLVPTGGSSGGAKLIPWTRGLAGEFQRALGPWIADLYRSYPAASAGPAYWSVSPLSDESPDHSAVPIGFEDDSAYVGGFLGPLLKSAFAVPSSLRFCSDAESFRYATLRCLLSSRNLALVSVWHPSFFSLLLDAAQTWRETLIADIDSGRISAKLPSLAVQGLSLRADQKRAAELRSVDWHDPRALWPHLAVVSCWADAAASGPCASLSRRLNGIPIQPKGLLATEGVVTIPWKNQNVLAVRSHVYEFIAEDGSIHWADELAIGQIYEVVLTTGGGLYRYRMGDRVRVQGFVGRTPYLSFMGRGELMVDLCGEKLDEAFVSVILQRLIGGLSSFAMLAPDYYHDQPAYTLYTDHAGPGLADKLDEELKNNPQYHLARRLNQLGRPRLYRVDHSASAVFFTYMSERGVRLGDVKPVGLHSDSNWSNRFLGRYIDR